MEDQLNQITGPSQSNMQQIVKRTRHERSYMEEDFGPDYLMPANGGLNPKRKKIYEENVEVEY